MAILKDALVQGDLVTTGNIRGDELSVTQIEVSKGVANENASVTVDGNETLTGKVVSSYHGANGSVNGGGAFEIAHGTSNIESMYMARRTDTENAIAFGVGVDGVHRGIYDYRLGKWIVYINNNTASFGGNADTSISATTLSQTLAVNKGGTGVTAFEANRVIMSGSTTTANLTSRAVTNNTATSTAITANTNLITANTLRYAINRTTSVAAADTNYTTYMARGMALNTSDTNPTVNGAISWTYK